MSERNVAVARRWVELFNGWADVDEFLSQLDPEVELQSWSDSGESSSD
jgi:hypothetical protein